MLADVHVATPQPKKAASSTQIVTADGQDGYENRPVIRITRAEPFSGYCLEFAVGTSAAASRGSSHLRLWS